MCDRAFQKRKVPLGSTSSLSVVFSPMLGSLRLASRPVPPRLASRLYSSRSPTYPFSNLRAFPFAISPQDAIVQLGPFASVTCMFNGLLGSLGARFLPGFGFEPLKPVRITPVYFPAWIIDAEVQASVHLSHGEESQQQTAAVHFVDSYLPGNEFKVLSSLSFWTKTARHTETVPFTEELTHQFGQQVSLIPYTVSPFSLIDAARSSSYIDATIDDDFRYIPSSVKCNMFAAYPMLIPLYLAQYELILPSKTYYVTLGIEAYTDKGRVFSERLGAEPGAALREHFQNAPSAFVKFTHALDNIEIQFLRGTPSPASNIPALMIMDPGKRLAPTLESWLDEKLQTAGSIEQLAQLSPDVISDEDPRVREYTTEETLKTRNWMALGAELWTIRSIVGAMEHADPEQARVFSIGLGSGNFRGQTVGNLVKGLRDNETAIRTRREELKPEWWKQWEEKSQGVSPESPKPYASESS
ncbi:hypothetical protein AX16_002377 [Volvariella volvacea WC 439]|nr:hypothetical protein AX16_002377 [Volvariella volvacea WC 439]